nr:hypothetical protein HAGR004_39230 [Bdellovibrio sp. HAGR004]
MNFSKEVPTSVQVVHSIGEQVLKIKESFYQTGAIPFDMERMFRQMSDDAYRDLQRTVQRWEKNGLKINFKLLNREAHLEDSLRGLLDEADLVVMGTHGRNMMLRAFLGSVARRIILKSPAPVIVIRANNTTPRSGAKKMKNGAAFITGAGSGIGRATAIAYAQAGIPVAVVDYNEQHAAETVDIIKRTLDVPAAHFTCDVSIDLEVNTAFFAAVERFGSVQYAFNNAGLEGEESAFEDITDENWEGVLNTNLRGVWLCMKYQLFHMAKAGGGSIVNCASIAGLVGFEKMAPYVASKHAVLGHVGGNQLRL